MTDPITPVDDEASAETLGDAIESFLNEPVVDSVNPTEIERQRSLGWPDFHPEDYCHRCGKAIPVWHADSELWFTAFHEARDSDGGGIMCPSCFAFAYEQATGTRPIWRFSLLAASPEGVVTLDGQRFTVVRPSRHSTRCYLVPYRPEDTKGAGYE